MFHTLICLIFLFAMPVVYADEIQKTPALLTDFIYPQTASWPQIDSYPHPSKEWLTADRDTLKESYLQSNEGKHLESLECSAIVAALDADDVSKFYRVTLPDDETLLLYSGPAECTEGERSAAWSLSQKHMEFSQLYMRVERIGAWKERALVGTQVGCCDDPINVSMLLNKQSVRRTDVLNKLEVPDTTRRVAENRIVHGSLMLRYSPAISNEYDSTLSEHFGNAILGNLMQMYLPGGAVSVIGKYVDASHVDWLLVKIDASQRNRLYYNPYMPQNQDGVVGWMKAACMGTTCDAAPFTEQLKFQ